MIDWYGVVTRGIWAGYGMLGLLEDPKEEGPANILSYAKKTRGLDSRRGGGGLVESGAGTLSLHIVRPTPEL